MDEKGKKTFLPFVLLLSFVPQIVHLDEDPWN